MSGGGDMKALLAKASPLPWTDCATGSVYGPDGVTLLLTYSTSTGRDCPMGDANRALIVAAVNALPGHIAVVERAEALLALLSTGTEPHDWDAIDAASRALAKALSSLGGGA